MFRPLFVAALALGLALAPSPSFAELPEGVTIERKVKAKQVERVFRGTWDVQVPPEMLRTLEITRAALSGQTIESLAHLNLTDEETMTFAMFQLMLQAEDGEEAREAMLRDIEAAASGMTFTVADGTIGVGIGGATTDATWSTVRTKNNLLVIRASMQDESPSEISVHFIDRNRAVLTGQGNEPVFLNRAD